MPGKTSFALNYGRSEFPVIALYSPTVSARSFRWILPFEAVDYAVYLPISVDGLREPPRPYGMCAAHSLWELLGRDVTGERVLAALPRIVFPLRQALSAGPGQWTVVVRALKTLQKLATAGNDGCVGRALVPYYRLLLAPLRRYLDATHVNSTDGLNYVTYNINELCTTTLRTLEYTGGHCAYMNIKYMIPTYVHVISCCRHDDGADAVVVDNNQ